MLHASILCGSSGLDNTLQRLATPEGRPSGLRAKTTALLFRSRGHTTFDIKCTTSPVADNMTGAARFQALGAISVQLTNVFRATRPSPRHCRRRRLAALAI